MAALVFCLLVLTLCISASLGAMCGGSPSPNAQPNVNPVYTGEPVFVRSVRNAKLYTAGEGDDILSIVHVYGTPYEMGFAHGELMKENATNFINAVWGYIEAQVEEAINGTVSNLKPWFVDLVAELGLDAALQWTVDATAPYTGEYFEDEMRGMADATGLPYLKILHIHMIGELTKGDCSMFGAWGNATRYTNSKLMQLRALDWDVDGPFKDFPQITVYHPSSSFGHAFANIGWTGWMGSITGISSTQLAISEIGVYFPDSTFGQESRHGIPFTFILRDILQFDQTIEDARTRITEAHRTCYLILGVGDGKASEFNGIQYSASVANFYTDYNNQPTASWHPLLENIVYYGMDWLCPGYDSVLSQQLMKWSGNITAENGIYDITPIVQTGNLHVAYYDLTNMILHIANARRDGAAGPSMAYDRTFNRLDMNQIFSVTQN